MRITIGIIKCRVFKYYTYECDFNIKKYHIEYRKYVAQFDKAFTQINDDELNEKLC